MVANRSLPQQEMSPLPELMHCMALFRLLRGVSHHGHGLCRVQLYLVPSLAVELCNDVELGLVMMVILGQ